MRTHRNVVALLGMCMEPLCIVTGNIIYFFGNVLEFCEQGSLLELLFGKEKLELALRINILRDVAAGMAHLGNPTKRHH
jgi:hypothetical protein